MKQSQSWFLCPVPGRSPRFMILRFYMKLYEKLVSDFRIIVIEKFGYGCSDLYEGPCDVDSVVAYQRRALENAGEKGPYILLPHSMSGLEAIRWKQKYPDGLSMDGPSPNL